jgi:tryptophan-rich sensory protein
MKKIVKLIIAESISFAAGAIGSVATIANIPSWYADLTKPFYAPPNWLFGPVWTTLYILIGISLYLVWTTPSNDSKKVAYWLFAIQIFLNAAWPLVFFGLHAPWAGVAVIIALLMSIVFMITYFWSISRRATYLLIPYLAWVSFATALTIGIALLN